MLSAADVRAAEQVCRQKDLVVVAGRLGKQIHGTLSHTHTHAEIHQSDAPSLISYISVQRSGSTEWSLI